MEVRHKISAVVPQSQLAQYKQYLPHHWTPLRGTCSKAVSSFRKLGRTSSGKGPDKKKPTPSQALDARKLERIQAQKCPQRSESEPKSAESSLVWMFAKVARLFLAVVGRDLHWATKWVQHEARDRGARPPNTTTAFRPLSWGMVGQTQRQGS